MDKYDLYAIHNMKGVGIKAITTILHIIESGSDPTENIDFLSLLPNTALNRYRKNIANALESTKLKKMSEEAKIQIDKLEATGCIVISILDDYYPLLLKQIDDPPPFLYCTGNIELLKKTNAVAVVGTRECTPRGGMIARKSVNFLCENNYTIVSGLALGIDTIAHEQALVNNADTIAVLVDVQNIQPKSNKELAKNILSNNGLLIAEMPPGTPIIPAYFVQRDRIQSGLSLAVFPIETSISGGTRHAVNNAGKQNRLVFTPDTTQSGYPDTSIHQLEGIIQFIKDKKAVPYTKEDYGNILNLLEKKKEELITD